MTDNEKILFKKFEILSCYKKDEFYAVYLANHIYLEKKVFLKVLNTNALPDSSILERFKQEAKILAKLEHPNIIKVYDFGMFKDFFYISFEYFESHNLREAKNSRNFSVEEKINILTQTLKGLNYSHTKNIIHRDIKPENILINENNQIKITDYGLAQDSLSNVITQKYSLVGTPAYLSPEQINGQAPNIKTDLFSLGVTMLELFIGKNILLGNDTNKTINNIINFSESDIENYISDLPENIQTALRSLLATEPEKRFSSCSEVLELFDIEQEIVEDKKNPQIFFAIPILLIVLLTIFLNVFTPKSKVEVTEKLKSDDSTLTAPKTLIPVKNEIEEKAENQTKKNELTKSKKQTEIQETTKEVLPKTEKKLEGTLYVKCYPWAKIYLNNEYLETTPISKNFKLSKGKYLLKLVHPEYPEFQDSIEIIPNKLSFVEINLDTLWGYLDCKIYPWAEILIEGKKKGTTPLAKPIKMKEGNYNLTLKNPNFSEVQKKIIIRKKDTLRINHQFN